ncbi:hypothetical protein [Bacteroides cellulosilyticus]|jgi:hypothetical protein|nr:hypothetical protein [Bacteroides cellulosilyticus]DAT94808.1 MAG TPA: hypothetical protein [Caudoviricetes sp.]
MQLKPCITTPDRQFTAPLPRLFRETTQTNRNQDRHFPQQRILIVINN